MSRRKKERRALARAAAAAAGADGSREPGRFSARRKTETILRLLRGESLDTLARELGVTAATLGAVAGSVLRRRASGAEEPTRRRMGRRDPAAPSQGRRDHDEQRVAARAVPPVGGQPAFTAAEAERMSQTCSPSTLRRYGLARVCRVWELARSTVYLLPGRVEVRGDHIESRLRAGTRGQRR